MKYTILSSKRNILYLLLHALFPCSFCFIAESLIDLIIFSLIFGGNIFVLLIKSSSILLGSWIGYSHCLKKEETKYVPK